MNFTTNYSDIENDALSSVRILSLPANGTLRVSSTAVTINQVIPAASLNNVNFVPTANRNGTTSFSREASDGQLYSATSAVVTLVI